MRGTEYERIRRAAEHRRALWACEALVWAALGTGAVWVVALYASRL